MMPPPPSEAPPKKKRGTFSFLSLQCDPHVPCCLQFLPMKSCSCHTCPTRICMKRAICIEIRSTTLQFHQSMYQTFSIQYNSSILTTCFNSNDFIITTSVDGHLKFWKKTATGVEFVKHYRAHLGTIVGISLSADGELLATISDDQALKVFDVTNFGKWMWMAWKRATVSLHWHWWRYDQYDQTRLQAQSCMLDSSAWTSPSIRCCVSCIFIVSESMTWSYQICYPTLDQMLTVQRSISMMDELTTSPYILLLICIHNQYTWWR